MQTFLPVPSFEDTARLLDRQRLGKQRLEALQIVKVLVGETTGWAAHPAVRMWVGYPAALIQYGMAMCTEWRRRGYKDTLLEKFQTYERSLTELRRSTPIMPPWFGDQEFHRAHQSNLVRKMPEHYRPLFPDVPANLPYKWPT